MKPIAYFLLLSFFGLSLPSYGQKPHFPIPTVGDPPPDFRLNVLQSGKKPALARSLRDYHGKWLILDFWTRSCAVCIKSMPKLDSLQHQFSNQAAFLLVGKNDTRYNRGIESLYQRLAAQGKFTMDVAFDSLIFKPYGVKFTPHVAIIDPKGKLAVVTYSSELTAANLENLFAGRNEMASLYGTAPEAPPLVSGRKVSDPSSQPPHQSSLSPWKAGEPISITTDLGKLKSNRLLSQGSSISKLYQLAYMGKMFWDTSDSLYRRLWPKPLIETSRPKLLESDIKKGIGTYTYQLELNAVAAVPDIQRAMQADLNYWFGHKVSFQQRQMPVYVLRLISAAAKEKLRSQSDLKSLKGDYSGYQLQKVNVPELIAFLYRYHRLVIFDETGLDQPIDLKLDANMTDLKQVKAQLVNSGLELMEVKMPIQVMVIQ